MLSQQQKTVCRTRMAAARRFLDSLDSSARRDFLAELGVDEMPTIVPALKTTPVGDIAPAVRRHLEAGERYVIIPVSGSSADDNAAPHFRITASGPDDSHASINLDGLSDESTIREVIGA